jgi:hypothetical protein
LLVACSDDERIVVDIAAKDRRQAQCGRRPRMFDISPSCFTPRMKMRPSLPTTRGPQRRSVKEGGEPGASKSAPTARRFYVTSKSPTWSVIDVAGRSPQEHPGRQAAPAFLLSGDSELWNNELGASVGVIGSAITGPRHHRLAARHACRKMSRLSRWSFPDGKTAYVGLGRAITWRGRCRERGARLCRRQAGGAWRCRATGRRCT